MNDVRCHFSSRSRPVQVKHEHAGGPPRSGQQRSPASHRICPRSKPGWAGGKALAALSRVAPDSATRSPTVRRRCAMDRRAVLRAMRDRLLCPLLRGIFRGVVSQRGDPRRVVFQSNDTLGADGPPRVAVEHPRFPRMLCQSAGSGFLQHPDRGKRRIEMCLFSRTLINNFETENHFLRIKMESKWNRFYIYRLGSNVWGNYIER